MSGGAWDYVYEKFEDTADRLSQENVPIRRALGAKISQIAKALRAVEWVDSGDSTSPYDEEKIREALGDEATKLEMEQLQVMALDIQYRLDAMQEEFDRES